MRRLYYWAWLLTAEAWEWLSLPVRVLWAWPRWMRWMIARENPYNRFTYRELFGRGLASAWIMEVPYLPTWAGRRSIVEGALDSGEDEGGEI